jgi:DUF1365 family protein
MTLKVIAGIHWEALFLWLNGAPLHRRPEPSAVAISFPPAEPRRLSNAA